MSYAEEQQLMSQKTSSLKSPGLQKKKTVTFSIVENGADEKSPSLQNIKTSTKKKSKRVSRKPTPHADYVSPSTSSPKRVSYGENPFGVPNKISELTILPVSVQNRPNYSYEKEDAPKGQGRKNISGMDSSTNTELKEKGRRIGKPLVEVTSQETETETGMTNYKSKQKRKIGGDGKEGKPEDLKTRPSKSFGTQTDTDLTNYKTKRSREKGVDEDESQTKNKAQHRPTYGSLPSKSCATQTDNDITNFKPKPYMKPYSEDTDPNNERFSSVQSKPDKYGNMQHCPLHPEEENISATLYPKSGQSHSEQKKRRPTSNKNGVDRKGELFNEVKVFIPCERFSYEENARVQMYSKEHPYSKNGGVINERFIPVHSEPKKNDKNSGQLHPKDKNDSVIFYPKLEHSQTEMKRRRASSNKNGSRSRVSDASKNRSFSNQRRRRSNEKRFSQAQQQQSENPYNSRLFYEGRGSLISDIQTFIPCDQHEDKEKLSRKENRRHSNPPIDRDALKAKLESVVMELKEKERKREELLKMLKVVDSEKNPEVDPISYSRSNSSPPLDREVLRDAKLTPSTPFIPYNPQSQRKAGGDADNRQSKRPKRVEEDGNNPQSATTNLRSKAPRSKTYVYAMKRYHIQIPEKGREETPFNVRFNLNDEQSVDMSYNGPVKISNYYSTTKYN